MIKFSTTIIFFNFFYISVFIAIFCLFVSLYFKDLVRFSLKEFTVILDDTQGTEWDEWEARSIFTQEELIKMELEENKPVLGKLEMYSLTEEKFVDFDISILIQRGDENSLLKRGVYFNLARSSSDRPFFRIKKTQFQSVNEKHPKYNYENGWLSHPTCFVDIYNAARVKIQKDKQNSLGQKNEDAAEEGKFLYDVFVKEEFLIEIGNVTDHFWESDDNKIIGTSIINSSLNLMIPIIKEIYVSDIRSLTGVEYDPYKVGSNRIEFYSKAID